VKSESQLALKNVYLWQASMKGCNVLQGHGLCSLFEQAALSHCGLNRGLFFMLCLAPL